VGARGAVGDRTPSGWHAREYESFGRAFAACAQGSDSGRLLERDGLIAVMTPGTPDRSVFNSVMYERPEALARALDDLAAAYGEAGIYAWTVWVPESDRGSARLLDEAGHRLDANPTAMVLELAELPDPEPGDLEWDPNALADEVSRVNDLAYGDARGVFSRGIGDPPAGTFRWYRARLDGEVVAVLGTLDHEGNCGIYWVATIPEARGRGLSRRLLHVALAEAKERGCDLSTLEATKLGRPVYERLGYRDVGTLQMWERRTT
jgi:GNAT superfamily N-acetyltransferase